MQKFSEHFNLPTSSVEARKIRRQEKCIHFDSKKVYANPANRNKWMVVCVDCKKVVGSDASLSTDGIMKSKEIVI